MWDHSNSINYFTTWWPGAFDQWRFEIDGFFVVLSGWTICLPGWACQFVFANSTAERFYCLEVQWRTIRLQRLTFDGTTSPVSVVQPILSGSESIDRLYRWSRSDRVYRWSRTPVRSYTTPLWVTTALTRCCPVAAGRSVRGPRWQAISTRSRDCGGPRQVGHVNGTGGRCRSPPRRPATPSCFPSQTPRSICLLITAPSQM